MTLRELRRALGGLCMMAIFASSFVLHKEEEEHDEHKARTRLVFNEEGRKVKETRSLEPKPLV